MPLTVVVSGRAAELQCAVKAMSYVTTDCRQSLDSLDGHATVANGVVTTC